MKCMRSADQFVHTDLDGADEVHQLAHELLKEWEKFAIKLDQRRKLLAVVVSFYQQTEEASAKLGRLDQEISIEKESDDTNKEVVVQIKKENREPGKDFTEKHLSISNQIAEISAPGLREGKIILEKLSKDNYEAEHIIKRVSCLD
jgi:hypothetical protein